MPRSRASNSVAWGSLVARAPLLASTQEVVAAAENQAEEHQKELPDTAAASLVLAVQKLAFETDQTFNCTIKRK